MQLENFIIQPTMGTAYIYGLLYDTFMHTEGHRDYSNWFCNGDCIWAYCDTN